MCGEKALRDAALAGRGIALLPQLLIEQDLLDDRLERVLPRATFDTAPIIALYPHKRHLESRVRHFIDMLKEYLQSRAVARAKTGQASLNPQ